MGKFRLRKGDIEVEYEGSDSEERYEAALQWIGSESVVTNAGKGIKSAEEKKPSVKGGSRTAIFAPAIKSLLAEGFFKLPKKRVITEISAALRDKGIPVSKKETQIVMACKRLLGKGLKGTKDGDKWVFWED